MFSSTAAVYAHGLDRPIRETDPIVPATPYGTSKLAVEHLLQGYADAYGFGATALRYFNASGADSDGRNGEAHRVETHVIPLLVQSALGQRGGFKVFGDRLADPRRQLHPRLRRRRRTSPRRTCSPCAIWCSAGWSATISAQAAASACASFSKPARGFRKGPSRTRSPHHALATHRSW